MYLLSSTTYLWDLYGNSIAWDLLWELYGIYYQDSLSHSLSTRLILRYPLS